MKTHSLILTLALILSCYGYILDENNYFYLNTSYTKNTISFTICFHVNQTTSLTMESDVLVPQGNHITRATLDKEKGFVFDNAFEPDSIGFNNYDH